MNSNWQVIIGEEAMVDFGAELGSQISAPSVIYLHGDLGAGKTTVVRGILRHFGWQGPVKSPTYTLVESYSLNDVDYHHFDLYRLADPEELEFLGIRDYLESNSVCLVEWPERGNGIIPAANFEIHIEYQGDGRLVQATSIDTWGHVG